ADHRVHDEVALVRLDELVDPLQLVHQLLVDLEPAGGVEDHGVVERPLGLRHGVAAHVHRVGLLAVDRDVDLLAERLELLDGPGPLEVRRGEHRLAAAVAERQRQLRRGGRLARALEAAEHEYDRAVRPLRDAVIDRAHQPDEFLVDDLDDLLGGVDPGEHVLADGLGLDAADEVGDDVVIDVGLDERLADLAEPLADVVGGQPAAAAELLERLAERPGNAFEHAAPSGETGRARHTPCGNTGAAGAAFRYSKTIASPLQPDRKAGDSRRYLRWASGLVAEPPRPDLREAARVL